MYSGCRVDLQSGLSHYLRRVVPQGSFTSVGDKAIGGDPSPATTAAQRVILTLDLHYDEHCLHQRGEHISLTEVTNVFTGL